VRDRLAEELLARVLQWTNEDVAQERPLIQALAAYKYDEYQQFSPGSRFIESLALWLDQFATADERRTAYEFVKTRLIFCSSAEMRHLVEMAYPDHIRPIMIARCAVSDADRYRPSSVAHRTDFKVRQRQCLFLGLSDGARIDAFRRANTPALNHEQIWQTHELSQERVTKLLGKLDEHLTQILERQTRPDERRFRTVVLLDDFSASGTSYYALPATAPPGGKVAHFFDEICGSAPVSRLVDLADLEVFIVLYMATEQALSHLREASAATWRKRGIQCSVDAVQVLSNDVRLQRGGSDPINPLLDDPRYYDPTIHDSHMQKGGTPNSRYGYGDCGLPLVLHHNTPNNSIALLMSYEDKTFRGLFPRVQRHKEMS
jgi:hypothetical protein